MDKDAQTSSGFSISDQKSSSLLSKTEVVSLMKLHSTESFPSKVSMMGFQHQGNSLNRSSDGGGGVGPAGSNSGGGSDVGGENLRRSCTQPFDIFAASYLTSPYKSPGGNMGTTVGFPFTFGQWKELERQAMIYKYMVSSVPVPSDLLFPLSTNYPAAPIHSSSLYNVRYLKNGDPEPGRCKRTDGKKWRCSRDVAPHQKYCERHLHRGRPRSRKPVEVKKNDENNKKPRIEKSSVPTSPQQFVAANNQQPLLLFNANTDLSISTAPSYKGTNRDSILTMEVDPTVEAERQWHRMMEANMGFTNEGSSIYNSTLLFPQHHAEQHPLNLLSFEGQNGNFTDAWSINSLNLNNNGNVKSSLSANHDLNLYPSLDLSIAMAAGDAHICKDWEPFAQGGPLAEALQPGSGVVGCSISSSPSPHDSISPAATTVSSPSGVLQRTLFSHSDSSVCNSPTFVGPSSDFAFHRLN